MNVNDHDPSEENDILARHNRLAEVMQGKRLLEWSDLETFAYDSHCLTLQGKQVAIWSIAVLKKFLKENFFKKAQQTKEILTQHPFFTYDYLLGANDVPRVYAEVFRLALQMDLLQSLDRFNGILRDTINNVESVRWFHTLLQFEIASLGQKEGWQVQFELPYNNGTNNKSDVALSKDGFRIEVDAISLRLSESGQKKQKYFDWLTFMSIQYGINITGRIGQPWAGTKKEEEQWIQKIHKALRSVLRTGINVIVYEPHGGNLIFERASSEKWGIANIQDADVNENVWLRIEGALKQKNDQASGNLAWIRMREHAGLWHWTQYRDMTLAEKLNTLSPMVQTALENFPHISGIILSPGILPMYHKVIESSSKTSSANGSIALQCPLPGYCSRECIIIPRRGMNTEAIELLSLYEHEDSWLDWALQKAGHPPFYKLVTEL